MGQSAFEAAFGTLKWLRTQVADPEGFASRRKETVLVFSDQIPFWVKVGACRQLYKASEVKRSRKSNIVTGLRGCDLRGRESQVCRRDEEDPLRASMGSQLRQQGRPEADRYRITVEARQEIHNFFDRNQAPKGVHGDNLSDRHRGSCEA